MAKRGYRGKHPHNDMKVSQTAVNNKAANNSKLVTEYGKQKSKLKYQYIRCHDGFYPVATGTIVCHGNNADDETIVIISTDGTSKTYTGKDAGTDASAGEFNTGGTAAAAATGLQSCIEHANGHAGKITVDKDSATLTLTQVEPGPDGNTTITSGLTGGSATSFTGG